MSKILYGTDPEMFSTYEKDGETFCLPPYFFRKYLDVKASDDKRHPVFIETDYGKLHEDGAAYEMSIMPSHNPKELFDRVHELKKLAEESIISNFPQYCIPILQFLPTVGFEVSRWRDEGEEFFMATTFGCDPDLDAFNSNGMSQIIDAKEHPKRYGGGHFHFSGSEKFQEDPILAVKCLAITVGLSAVKNSKFPSLDRERTMLYGKPGKFRVQNYGKNNPFGSEYQIGIEYRTPSNSWLNSWKTAKDIFKWAEIGIHQLIETSLGEELIVELSDQTSQAIINYDKNLATELLEYVESRI